jgi:hypothetical protein
MPGSKHFIKNERKKEENKQVTGFMAHFHTSWL